MKNLKRRDWLISTLAAAGAAGLARLPGAAAEAGHDFSSDFGPDWELQKAYTLEVAEAMPAEKYTFKPTEEMRTFGELMAHIGSSNYSFSANARGAEPPAEARFEGEATKERVVAFLRGAFDYAAEAIASLDDQQAKEEISIFGGRLTLTRAKLIEFMRNHTTHHRGYALPYLRLNGIKPPAYRFTGGRPSPM
jgi:uncharacterized damage-inducible protein DinB